MLRVRERGLMPRIFLYCLYSSNFRNRALFFLRVCSTEFWRPSPRPPEETSRHYPLLIQEFSWFRWIMGTWPRKSKKLKPLRRRKKKTGAIQLYRKSLRPSPKKKERKLHRRTITRASAPITNEPAARRNIRALDIHTPAYHRTSKHSSLKPSPIKGYRPSRKIGRPVPQPRQL